MEQAAALGITKAKDLGKLFAMFLRGKLVSKSLIDLYKNPEVSHGFDKVILAPFAKGYGFMYERHPYKQVSTIWQHQSAG